jgi:hypothetical protein
MSRALYPGRVIRRLTLYEPRRRWWGGFRADILLQELIEPGQGADVFFAHDLARATWKPPFGWKYQTVDLQTSDRNSGRTQKETVVREDSDEG